MGHQAHNLFLKLLRCSGKQKAGILPTLCRSPPRPINDPQRPCCWSNIRKAKGSLFERSCGNGGLGSMADNDRLRHADLAVSATIGLIAALCWIAAERYFRADVTAADDWAATSTGRTGVAAGAPSVAQA
jgi:hypothetical protein